MKARDRVALALILAATGLEATAFFAASVVQSFEVYQQGHSAAALGRVGVVSHVLSMIGTLAAGVVALRIGPRFTAAAGALAGLIGLVAMLAGGALTPGFWLVSFGAGLIGPCGVVAAAEVLAWDDGSPAPPSPHRFAAVAAFAAALGLASIGTGFAGNALAGLVIASLGARAGYAGAGALVALSSLLFAAAALLGVRWASAAAPAPPAGPYREPTAAPAYTEAPASRSIPGVAKLFGMLAAYYVAMSLTSPPTSLLFGGASASSIGRLYLVREAAVLVGSAGALALLLVAAFQRWTSPPLALSGAALVVLALGLVPLAFAGSSQALYVTGALVTGVASAACSCVPLAYAAIAVRGRAATLVAAVWTVLGALLGQAGTVAGALPSTGAPLLLLCALLNLGAGAILLRRARPLHRAFDPT